MGAFEIVSSKPEFIVVSVGFSEEDKSKFEVLNPPREDGFPKVKEISSGSGFVANAKDPNFDKPLSELEKEY